MSISFRKFPFLPVLAGCVLAAASVRAADIRIVGKANPADKQTVSFARLRTDESPAAKEFRATLWNDLLISGWFVPVDAESASVQLAGSVSGGAGVNASFRALWAGGTRQRDWSRAASADFVRDAAHECADGIVAAVAGERPMASSKIAFVGKRGGATDIYECDADGRRVRQITSGGRLCLSPNWEPRTHSFLYTTWRTGLPAVWRVNLVRNKQRMVCNFPGMNLGATASPADGRVAVVLSRSGQVDLYVVDGTNPNRILDRLTNSRNASESSPSWSPDGRSIVYVSDSGGTPRIYSMSLAAKTPRRLVYSSSLRETVAPEWGVTGEIAFCGRSGGRYGVYVIDPSRDSRTATPAKLSPEDGADYEDPSWAPDGRHVVCTRTQGRRRSLVVLDTKGDAPRTLFDLQGDWYLPSWSDNLRP